MLKIYFYEGRTRQYEEGKQPEGAVEVKKTTPAEKAKEAPANKSRKSSKTK